MKARVLLRQVQWAIAFLIAALFGCRGDFHKVFSTFTP
jgi:hypothetical protein